MNTNAASEEKQAPNYVGGKPRIATVPLEWPVEYGGKVYGAITIKRLTTREVAEFMEKLEATEDGRLRWPIFIDGDGVAVPDVVLDALDDDDNMSLQKVLLDFLPRRFRGKPEAEESSSV